MTFEIHFLREHDPELSNPQRLSDDPHAQGGVDALLPAEGGWVGRRFEKLSSEKINFPKTHYL